MARENSKNIFMSINQNFIFFERSFFLILASFYLGICLLLHQPNPSIILDFSHPIMNVIFTILLILHGLLNLWAFFDLDIAGFVRMRIFEKNAGTHVPIQFNPKPPTSLSKMMRHPIYYCAIAEIWLSSTKISYGRLFFNTFFTIFVLFGTLLEEKEIIKKYPSYMEYVKEVPNKYFPDITQLFKKYEKNN